MYMNILIMYVLNVIFMLTVVISAVPIEEIITTTARNNKTVASRRILRGRSVGLTRPYMVYLAPAPGSDPKIAETDWICGGTIIHERYILTSAACIEDAKHFYVVSGTHHWMASQDNECVKNGAKKAIWKCVPKAYFFDGDDFDNIRWMVGDIAVVKVEDNFNFERRVRGCDFIPKKVSYNNKSETLEKSGTIASIAGWGSDDTFVDTSNKSSKNAPDLLETDVILLSKTACKKRWDKRYHSVIDDNMICSRDTAEAESMKAVCTETVVNCKELEYSEEESGENRRYSVLDSSQLQVDTAMHIDARKKGHRMPSGGFCENDHGGPLIVGQGKSAVVVGVMSACLTKEITHKCYGPFLYTSVYKYKDVISCAIENDVSIPCKGLLRTSKTIYDWSKQPDALRKSEHIYEAVELNMHNKNSVSTISKFISENSTD